MNMSQLKSKLRVGIGNPSTADVPDTNSTGTGLIDYINEAYAQLTDGYDHHVLKPRQRFTTISGTDKYELPATVGAILHVWDRTNKLPLKRVTMDYVKRNEFDPAATPAGKPEKYAHVDDFLQLLPVPNGAYVIEFQSRLIVTPLSADTDIPILPTTWHRGIVALARWEYWVDQGDVAKAAAAKAMYDMWVSGKPLEADEEKMFDDAGIEIPTLSETADKRLDFDHSN